MHLKKRNSKIIIQRKGRASKGDKIQKVLKNVTDASEAFLALEPFNLSSEEERMIVGKWKTENQILRCHGVI
jgi:hypothetical protein